MISNILSFLLVIILIIVVFVLLCFFVICGFLCIIFLLLFGIFCVAQLLPLLSKSFSFRDIICHDHVVENRPCLDLPQIEANETEVGKLIHFVVVNVLWIGDLLGLPDAFVRRVGNSF